MAVMDAEIDRLEQLLHALQVSRLALTHVLIDAPDEYKERYEEMLQATIEDNTNTQRKS